MDTDKQKSKYSTEIASRMGCFVYTFYYEDIPFGSLMLNPNQDQLIIDDIDNVIKRWNTQYRENESKEERTRRDVRGRIKTDESY